MTRQEVIERLKSIKSLVDKYDDVIALREAIKALEREPMFIAKSDGTIEQIKNCDDCLFKKEWEKIGKLISVVLEKQNDAEYHGIEDMDGLYYCPICQQTTTVVKDGKCPKCGATMDELSTREQTEDAISRQAVLDIIEDRIKNGLAQNVAISQYYRMEVEKLPPINPREPKTGHWIAQGIYNCHTDFMCSKCGYIHSFMHLYGQPTADYTYCPNCGAKMESEGAK